MNIWATLSRGAFVVFSFILQRLPDADSSTLSIITSYSSQFKTAIAWANWFFPLPTFFGMVLAVIQIETAVLGWHIAKLVLRIASLGFLRL